MDKYILAAYIISQICVGDLVDDAIRALIMVYDEDNNLYEFDLNQYDEDPKRLSMNHPFQDMIEILQEKNDA